ncbi:hypothetical protein VNO78_23469 [Psophocarpus tetragonolobus]|uniref:Uncharacterized protein n=1 Tax=Psophocarpus tetragonolobus TaxID=3891 RepID=A0AAN9XDW2_PSOTE
MKTNLPFANAVIENPLYVYERLHISESLLQHNLNQLPIYRISLPSVIETYAISSINHAVIFRKLTPLLFKMPSLRE